jgi:hypothetical protein
LSHSPRFLDFSNHFDALGFTAGFSLEGFSTDGSDDRISLADALRLPVSELVIPKQTHSNHVQYCERGGDMDDTDGIIADKGTCVLSIQVADCIPMFFVQKMTGRFGLVHAGWRGVEKGIAAKALAFFHPEEIFCLLGPSIQQCCFEIGPEVAAQFPESFQKKGDGDRSFLNLQEAVINQLMEQGVPSHQIKNDGTCTACNRDDFHSYRRDGKKAGRHIAVAGWR